MTAGLDPGDLHATPGPQRDGTSRAYEAVERGRLGRACPGQGEGGDAGGASDSISSHVVSYGPPCNLVSRILPSVSESYPEGWNEVRGALQRGFRFEDFRGALAFVNRLGDVAEEAGHHPDIELSWNAVTVRWWTHTKRAITESDVEMARLTDELAAR